MSHKKKQKRITRKPRQSVTPRKKSQPPKGPQKIKIDEIKYLKFRITKLNEEILKLQEQKLDADQKVIDVTKANVGLRRQLTMSDINRIYDECGIEAGDQVVKDGDDFAILRPAGGTPAPRPPLEVVKDDGDEKGESKEKGKKK